ncbi:Mce protein [Mycolicibacterium sp. CBMA 234]|uniref:Mce protein n=1 Tax=Mycolicibacterium sp. CBMA 234 TaxID=1918495 RepID=UPI00192E3777|nr:Mce protein [Mycolicibacterium sp. CBMA 234]
MTQLDNIVDVLDLVGDEPGPHPGSPGPRRPGPRTLAAAVGLLILVTSLGTSIFLGWRAYHDHQLSTASQSALQAARDYAALLTTLDVKNIDDNYRRSLDGATGEFKDAYSQGSAQLRQILIDNKAVGSGVVVDAAVKSATPNTVDILLFVDQSITNAARPSPRIDRNRIAMTMTLVGGRWLASKVEML